MSTILNYLPVPVSAAQEIAEGYRKDIVVILAWSAQNALLHCTTFGRLAEHKTQAAELGDLVAAAAGMDLTRKVPYEDFRNDAARLKEENDRLMAAARKMLSSLKAFVAEFDEWAGPEEDGASEGAAARNERVRFYESVVSAIAEVEADCEALEGQEIKP